MKMRAAITLDAVGGRTTPVHPRAQTYRAHFVPEGSSSMLGVQFTSGPVTMALGESGEVEFECLYRGVRISLPHGSTPAEVVAFLDGPNLGHSR